MEFFSKKTTHLTEILPQSVSRCPIENSHTKLCQDAKSCMGSFLLGLAQHGINYFIYFLVETHLIIYSYI